MAIALVLGAVLLVHGPSAWFGFVGLDDQDLLADDAAFLRGPVNLSRLLTRSYMHVVDPHHPYFRPVVTASFALDAHGSGSSAFAYHATNWLVHACASLLFLGLLERFAMGAAATAGALLFAVHPALAAAVAWIPGRNDSLLALFVLVAWHFLPFEGTRSLDPTASPGPTASADPTASARAPRRFASLALHLVFFALALLTKETALLAPAVWAVHLALQTKSAAAGGAQTRPSRHGTYFVVAGWVLLLAARFALAPLPLPAALTVHPSAIRDALVFPSLALRSLGALVFPLNPSLLSDMDDLPLLAGVAALALAGAALFIPGVRWRVVAIGAAAYVLFLFPAFLAGTSLLLATRLYLPACGVLLVATEALRALCEHEGARRRAISLAFATAAVFAVLGVAYESTFANRRRFARAEADAAPHCAMAHFCLGASYQMDGDDVRALPEYRSAMALGAVEVVHNNVAVIEMARGEWSAAETDLRLEIAANPSYARAYRNLSIVLRHEGADADAASADAQAAALEGEADR